jgi:V8-like Glu-specific endopeptidase
MTFNHNFDTQTGNSGSPIWVEKDGRKICVGVHTFGGAATKLTKEDIDLIQSWIAAYHE